MPPFAKYHIEWKTLPREGQEDYRGTINVSGDSYDDATKRLIVSLNNTKFKDNPRVILITSIILLEVLGQEE